jgi:hypothetical protein
MYRSVCRRDNPSRSADAVGDDWWEWARADGQGRGLMCEARMRRAWVGGKGHGRVGEARTWRALTGGKGCGCVERVRMRGTGADSLCESGNGCNHQDRAQTGVATHTTIAKRTRVRVQTNGHQARVGTSAGTMRAHAATGTGV